MFAKVFIQIFDSSIANDYQLRQFFIDLLVLAELDGVVDMTPEAISARTRIPLDFVNKFLAQLQKPDPRSRSDKHQGRRIILLDEHRDWGWQIVNYDTYRAIASDEQRRERTKTRTRKWRESKHKPIGDAPVTLCDAGDAMQRQKSEAEAKAEVPPISPSARPVKPDKSVELATQARILIHYLNEKTGRHFRETSVNLSIMSERLSEAEVTVGGCMKMIDRQCDRWIGTEQSEYLRPETLFRKSKFDGYYAAKDVPIDKPLVNGHKSMLDLEIAKMTREADRITQNIR